MRSDDEDDEEEYEEENEEDEDEVLVNGAADADEDDADGDAEGDADNAMDEDEDEDEDEEEDVEGDVEGDGEGEEDEDEDEDEDNEGDEDEEDEDEDEDEDEEGEGEGEDEDVEMAEEKSSSSQRSRATAKSKLFPLASLPQPPHIVRRSLFTPSWTTPPASLSIEAIVGIPLPSPVHSIASTTCMTYLLAGSQDGYVRSYDFWASVNGAQLMTSQQKAVVGLGEGVSKAGVGRGWWSVEVEGIKDGAVGKRMEPVYSLACEGDGLWALGGTQSGPINMYTLRHAPGHYLHALKGHTNVVSCMTLLPDEKGLLSGSWDGTVREWDLNTGQTVRTYPTHGAQLSSIALRPFSHPLSPSPSPKPDAEKEAPKEKISVSVGPDFFEKRQPEANAEPNGVAEKDGPDSSSDTIDAPAEDNVPAAEAGIEVKPVVNDDIDMDKASSHDSLFDEDLDVDGETAPASNDITIAPTPSPHPTITATGSAQKSPLKPTPLNLALPGMQKPGVESKTGSSSNPGVPSSGRAGAASNIPLLSKTSYKQFSEDVILYSSMDGQVVLIDRRVPSYGGASGVGVGRLMPGEKAPPWCMSACWSGDGNQVLAGRRNGTVDIWDVRRSSTSSAPNLLRTLKTPAESGPVSCVVALPDGQHVATASQDNVRLWNTTEYFELDDSIKRSKSRPPFKIIAGHHGGIISSMLVDPTCRFLVTASGDRGWQGESTRVVLIHEIKW